MTNGTVKECVISFNIRYVIPQKIDHHIRLRSFQRQAHRFRIFSICLNRAVFRRHLILSTAEDQDFVAAFMQKRGAVTRNVSGPADE